MGSVFGHQIRSKLFPVVICVLLVIVVGLSGCDSPASTATSPTSESSSTLDSAQVSSFNIKIDYFGVTDSHGGNVQLVVVVSDGITDEKHLIPPVDEGFSDMGDFEIRKIDTRIFHTASAQSNVKLNILAYHRDNSKDTFLDLIEMMEWYYGDSINVLKNLVLNMPENDELIGYYEHTWYADEFPTTQQYQEVGVDDLRVWFSVWSDEEPPPITTPSPLLPDVEIQSVDIPDEVKDSSGLLLHYWYPSTIRIVNNESFEITIEWQGHSSATGNFDGGSITIRENSYVEIKRSYYYEGIGIVKITYAIFYKGTELDKWEGELNVIPRS